MSREYGIWLSFNNQEEGFRIPVNPPSIEMSDGVNSKVYDMGSKEINVIKTRKLTEYSFESIFPAVEYPFVIGDRLYEPVLFYVHLITKWMSSKRPIRFVFTGSTFDINEAVSIESFTWREVAGSPGDIEYKLTLKQYYFYAAKRVVLQSRQSGETAALVAQSPTRPDERVQPKTYTLRPGDNLWSVAQRVLGNGSRYPEIQKLNGITDAQLKRLQIGMVLKLPG